MMPLTPGAKRGQIDVTLRGDLDAILEAPSRSCYVLFSHKQKARRLCQTGGLLYLVAGAGNGRERHSLQVAI
jgi:hypothetical protein